MPHFVSEVKKSGSRETLSQLPLSITVRKSAKGNHSPTVLPHIPAMVALEALAYLA